MAEEVVLMKGNEAIAHAAIRFGVDGYFGYQHGIRRCCNGKNGYDLIFQPRC